MSKYAETKDIKITMPLGLYDEMIEIITSSNRWAYPQNFILDAIEEKIERWNKEHGAYGHPGKIPKKEENKKEENK